MADLEGVGGDSMKLEQILGRLALFGPLIFLTLWPLNLFTPKHN
jgi:hypothetical protein